MSAALHASSCSAYSSMCHPAPGGGANVMSQRGVTMGAEGWAQQQH